MNELLKKKKWGGFRRINFFLGCVGVLSIVIVVSNRLVMENLKTKTQEVTKET